MNADAALDGFVERYPEYATTNAIDQLRERDYSRLDRDGHIYLDYTGGSLYAESQIREHADLLASGVFGNPHSGSLSSIASTSLVEQTRRLILEFLHAPPDVYTVVFTQNATAALKLVGEAYPFTAGSRFALAFDNHNSVNGIREFACAARARPSTTCRSPLPDLRIDCGRLSTTLAAADRGADNLFAFPAQSNFSGVQHPLDLVDAGARERLGCSPRCRRLRADQPARPVEGPARVRDDLVLQGVRLSDWRGLPVDQDRHDPQDAAPLVRGRDRQLRDRAGPAACPRAPRGGIRGRHCNYLSIPAVAIGLRHLERMTIDAVHTRVRCLTGWLLEQLLALRHANGRPMVRIYGPATTEMRGGSVTMNFYDPDGHLLDYRRIEELASARRISLRTGCFCNPGAGETAEGLTEEDMLAGAAGGADMTLPRFMQVIQHRGGKSAGAIRVSLGLVSNFADVYRFVQFASEFRDQTRLTIGDVTFDIESCRVIRDGS